MSKPQIDKKTEVTFKTIENLKGSTNVFKEFMATATNYQRASLKLSEEGKKMADALQRVGQLQPSDLGLAIVKLAEMHRSIERYRDTFAKTLQDDLVGTLQKSLEVDKTELSQFETDYKRSRDNARAKIQKLEQNSKKAGKKGAAALQDSIKELDLGVKEADKIKAEKLRNVLLLERKKYCNFLTQWGMVISAEVDMFNDAMRIKDQQSFFSNLAASAHNLPPEMEALINLSQERTFVQIQGNTGDDSGGYSGGYNDYSSSYADTSYDTGYTDNSYGGGYGGGYDSGLGTCSALYDFAGDQPTDLPFYAGDVINVTADDDGSGWMTGELNGRTGIFPSSYVQRN